MQLTDYPAPDVQVAATVVDDQAVIVTADNGIVTVLNHVGSFIWQLIDGTCSVRDIVAAVTREYDVPADVAERDALEFIQVLVDAGAVSLQDTPAGSS